MENDQHIEPRCATCASVLPGPGAICHVCDVEMHFEGVLRSSPPLFTHRRVAGQQLPRVPQAS